MNPELRSRAEARLAEAAQARGLADPRPAYRERLRVLKHTHPDAFQQAVRHYDEQVLPALADRDPLDAWIEYGRFLASLTSAGVATAIDEKGRAAKWNPATPASLVLFIPDDTSSDVLPLVQPDAPSAAQAATIALLVEKKLKIE